MTSILISFLHSQQYSGKFTSTVSSYTFVFVLLPQIGQCIHLPSLFSLQSHILSPHFICRSTASSVPLTTYYFLGEKIISNKREEIGVEIGRTSGVFDELNINKRKNGQKNKAVSVLTVFVLHILETDNRFPTRYVCTRYLMPSVSFART